MPHKLRLLTETLATPIGELVVICDEEGRLRATDWTNYDARMHRLLARHYGEDHFTLTPAPNAIPPHLGNCCVLRWRYPRD